MNATLKPSMYTVTVFCTRAFDAPKSTAICGSAGGVCVKGYLAERDYQQQHHDDAVGDVPRAREVRPLDAVDDCAQRTASFAIGRAPLRGRWR
jgi:hypothetical protein